MVCCVALDIENYHRAYGKDRNKAAQLAPAYRGVGGTTGDRAAIVAVAGCVLTRGSIGMAAPAINSATLSGKPFSLQQFQGKPAVVHFWASWCPVCELEQGMVDSISADLPLITVAMQSGSPEEVRAYLAAQGVDYPVVNDERGWLSGQYGVKAVPASFILDAEGVVRFATRGYTTGWGLRTRLWLAGLF